MSQDLAALGPSAIVCVAFVIGAWVILRKELAPKRRARARAQARTQASSAAGQAPREPVDHEQGAS
jgi:hypothetical protein